MCVCVCAHARARMYVYWGGSGVLTQPSSVTRLYLQPQVQTLMLTEKHLCIPKASYLNSYVIYSKYSMIYLLWSLQTLATFHIPSVTCNFPLNAVLDWCCVFSVVTHYSSLPRKGKRFVLDPQAEVEHFSSSLPAHPFRAGVTVFIG